MKSSIIRFFVLFLAASVAAFAADTTRPEIVSASVTNGTTFTILFNEPVSIGSGGSGGFSIGFSAGAATLSYSSGGGGNSLVFELSRTVLAGEDGYLRYEQPGNGVEDLAGNDLAHYLINVPRPAPIPYREVIPIQNLVGAATPSNTVLPTIDNASPSSGDTLTVTTGTWSNSPTSYSYQWKRAGVNISGATSSSYVVEDIAGGLSCYVTATNAAGSSAPVRADSGIPRQLFVDGDSLSDGTYISALQTLLGSSWTIVDAATSGQNLNDMIATAPAEIDGPMHKGWGVIFAWEYANQVAGVQGMNSGAEVYALIQDYVAARKAANSGPVLVGSIFYRPGGIKDGTQSQIASDSVRDNWASFADGFVELDLDSLYNSAEAFDGVHITSEVFSVVAAAIKSTVDAMGLIGGCGDIPVAISDRTHLKTFTNPVYVYDPVNPLPMPAPSGSFITITGGAGWTPGTYQVNGGIEGFSTADGPQNLWNLASEPAPANTPNGEYTLP